MSDQTPSGSDRHLRRLMPAQAIGSGSSTGTPSPRSRLNTVKAACNPCRRYKAKCFGERPSCSRCLDKGLLCQYTTLPGESRMQAFNRNHHNLNHRATVNEEILNLLKTLPERDAQEILKRIRSDVDVEAVLNQAKAGDLLLQVALVPETRLRYEFPYRSEMPAGYARDNPYLDSLIYEGASLYSTSQDLGNVTPRLMTNLGSEEQQSLYLKPFHAAHVAEPLLSNVKTSAWTTVCNDDVLMRDLLGVLFRCEYQFTAAFQKDLFLEDMAANRKDFCSSLLVNIVLAYACVCYPGFSNRAEYWNPNTLSYRFLAEAKRLWELECSEPCITTIQAGILFSVFHNLCGLDEIGQPYRIHAVSLAHEIRIFDVMDVRSQRIQNGRVYTAWALYSWETLVAFSFMLPPLLKKPPQWALPDPTRNSQWYGEIWIKYPMTNGLSPSYFSHVFRARCHFRIIMHEICDAAYSEGSEITLEKAHGFRERLGRWYRSLPVPLQPRTIVLPGHLQLHIYYHHLLLTLYEPLCDVETVQVPFVQRIVADAKKHLQTLVRLYYLRHGFEAMDLFVVIPLMLTGYDCIDAIGDHTPATELETLRSTLILIAQGLYSQRRNHYLAEALFRVIRGRMRPQELALLRGTMSLEEQEAVKELNVMQPVRSHWPVSVVKKQEDVDAHILKNLVKSYASLNVEDHQGQTAQQASYAYAS
ncbi:Zn(2)-C6 fungal-type domain-containing protein [Fusarium sp. LHS14.1]|nr:Zn(2)-C6 fungal-type domain-containing protein [Fusarium sp. LHS14.1]